MKGYKRESFLTLVAIIIVLVAFAYRLFGEGIGYENYISPGLLFLTIGALIYGILFPYIDFERHIMSPSRVWLFLIVMAVVALCIFIPMIVASPSTKTYDKAFDSVVAISICLAIGLNHLNYLRLKTEWDKGRVRGAVGWTALGMGSVVGLMMSFKDKKKKK